MNDCVRCGKPLDRFQIRIEMTGHDGTGIDYRGAVCGFACLRHVAWQRQLRHALEARIAAGRTAGANVVEAT